MNIITASQREQQHLWVHPEHANRARAGGCARLAIMRSFLFGLPLVLSALACGPSTPALSPSSSTAAGDHGHTYAECKDAGHPVWRSDTHPSRELSEDEAKLHVTKYPGHKPVIREDEHP